MGTAELKAIGQFQNSEYYYDNTTTSHIYEFSGPLNFVTAENLSSKSTKENELLAGPVILVMSKEIGWQSDFLSLFFGLLRPS